MMKGKYREKLPIYLQFITKGKYLTKVHTSQSVLKENDIGNKLSSMYLNSDLETYTIEI